MCYRTLLLCSILLLGIFPSGWKTLAQDCMNLNLYAMKVATCCHLESFIRADTYDECSKTMDEKYPDKKLQKIVCSFDCMYREMGVLTGVDEIDVEKINANQAGYDDAYQEAIAKAASACVAQKGTIREEAEMIQTECSLFATKFHACMSLETMKNCPAERWDSSVLCEKVREGVMPCPP
uniref:Uncharacterized protein n=1 Tax=Anopheles christyi TaxID=43041 RepID=A0A9I3A6N7_9DIPT